MRYFRKMTDTLTSIILMVLVIPPVFLLLCFGALYEKITGNLIYPEENYD